VSDCSYIISKNVSPVIVVKEDNKICKKREKRKETGKKGRSQKEKLKKPRIKYERHRFATLSVL
jgi:hypothetical protein